MIAGAASILALGLLVACAADPAAAGPADAAMRAAMPVAGARLGDLHVAEDAVMPSAPEAAPEAPRGLVTIIGPREQEPQGGEDTSPKSTPVDTLAAKPDAKTERSAQEQGVVILVPGVPALPSAVGAADGSAPARAGAAGNCKATIVATVGNGEQAGSSAAHAVGGGAMVSVVPAETCP